jgi:tRNA (guanine37-N1)-methyltransferase
VHHTVDDTPFGGGPGMVMKPDVWGDALDAVLPDTGLPDTGLDSPGATARLIVPTPSGTPFTQELAAAYAREAHLVFACGRYEGIDSRVVADVRTRMPVDEVSIGDYVLAGGEAAVAVIVEAVCRLLPGVLGNEQSHSDDSFGGTGGAMSGLLEGRVYTRPRTWRERDVPDVLLSGNHQAIARWQRDEALRRTAVNRPDLIRRLAAAPGGLDKRDLQVLADAGFPVDTENMAH